MKLDWIESHCLSVKRYGGGDRTALVCNLFEKSKMHYVSSWQHR